MIDLRAISFFFFFLAFLSVVFMLNDLASWATSNSSSSWDITIVATGVTLRPDGSKEIDVAGKKIYHKRGDELVELVGEINVINGDVRIESDRIIIDGDVKVNGEVQE